MTLTFQVHAADVFFIRQCMSYPFQLGHPGYSQEHEAKTEIGKTSSVGLVGCALCLALFSATTCFQGTRRLVFS